MNTEQEPLTLKMKKWSVDDLKDIPLEKRSNSEFKEVAGLFWTAVWATVYYYADHLVGIYRFQGGTKMSIAFKNLLKHIDKLSHMEKEKLFQWVKRYVEPTSSVGGHLINEMRETRFNEGFECPHWPPNILFASVKIMGVSVINVNVAKRPFQI